eukprot:RCo000705
MDSESSGPLSGDKQSDIDRPPNVNSRSRARKSSHASGGAKGQSSVSTFISPSVALKTHSHLLTEYEQKEIQDHPQIYFMGFHASKISATQDPKLNHGFDDERGDYQLIINDHVTYRYEILEPLGKGSFGQVIKAFDHKLGSFVALKIIRNKRRFHHQAQVEIQILEHLRKHDPEGRNNVVRVEESFYFRNHLFLAFELLGINLYEYIKSNNFHGLSLDVIRRIARQLLVALSFLSQEKIIHCDLKPENILLRPSSRMAVKLIDFG